MTLKGFLDQLKEDGSRKAKSTFPVVSSECLLGRGEHCDLRLGTPSQVQFFMRNVSINESIYP